jgi:multidrug resistance protein MdtO
MEPAKDRVIGILLGNIVIFVIFTTIWPVSVADIVRANVAKALEQFGKLAGLGARTDGEVSRVARSAAAAAFGQAIARARAVLVYDPLETGAPRRATTRRHRCDCRGAGRSSVHPPLDDTRSARRSGQTRPPATRRDAISRITSAGGMVPAATSWVRSGEGAGEVLGGLPEPPVLTGPGDHLAALATWYGLLHQDIRSILDEVGPKPPPAMTPSLGDAFHAIG